MCRNRILNATLVALLIHESCGRKVTDVDQDAKVHCNFVFLVLEPTGDVWIGHTARKGGRFGVLLELKKAAFEVKNDRLTGHYRTNGEESFGDSKYTIDLTFSAPIEGQ